MTPQEKTPAYQWYPRDFQADEHVRLMGFEQRGIYRELLDHAWLHGSIPSDLAILARLLGNGLTLARLTRLWPAIAPCWVAVGEDRLMNARQERDRGELEEFRRERSETGRRGADVRWARDRHKRGDSSANGSAINQPLANDGPAPAPASATASATTTARHDDTPTEAERVVRESLPGPEYLAAFANLLRGSGKPDDLAASVRGYGPGGIHEFATWEEVGHGLMDCAAAPGPTTPGKIKGFIRRIQRGDPPPRAAIAPRQTQREKNMAVLAAIAAEEEAA